MAPPPASHQFSFVFLKLSFLVGVLRGSGVRPWLESHLLRVVLVLLAPELSHGSVLEKWLFSVCPVCHRGRGNGVSPGSRGAGCWGLGTLVW